jgi:phosphoribosylformimino-5-aminoimidazole carboxamide ribotide isomerase
MPNGYKGPVELLRSSHDWPTDVIAMTLSRVGSNSGVDLAVLQCLLKQASHQRIYAAGGIRNCDDIVQLRSLGVHGALVASALHSKQITANDLTAFTA